MMDTLTSAEEPGKSFYGEKYVNVDIQGFQVPLYVSTAQYEIAAFSTACSTASCKGGRFAFSDIDGEFGSNAYESYDFVTPAGLYQKGRWLGNGFDNDLKLSDSHDGISMGLYRIKGRSTSNNSA